MTILKWLGIALFIALYAWSTKSMWRYKCYFHRSMYIFNSKRDFKKACKIYYMPSVGPDDFERALVDAGIKFEIE